MYDTNDIFLTMFLVMHIRVVIWYLRSTMCRYGWTYVDAAYDDGLLFSRGALVRLLWLVEVVELTKEGNVRMSWC